MRFKAYANLKGKPVFHNYSQLKIVYYDKENF